MHQEFSKRIIFIGDNQYNVVGVEKQGRKCFFITACQKRFNKKQISCYQLFCVQCDILKESRKFFNTFLYTKSWSCQSCNKIGEKNPFYGKKWAESVDQDWLDVYRKSRSEKYSGSKNPMYGKPIQEIWKEKYSQEELEKRIIEWDADILIVGEEYKDKVVFGSEHVKSVIFFPKVGNFSTTNILKDK